ncbi:MAG: hypothetical protein AABZ60_19065 [Planctomycetota bacterium]
MQEALSIRGRLSKLELFFSLCLIASAVFGVKCAQNGYYSSLSITIIIVGFLGGFWLLLENLLQKWTHIYFEGDTLTIDGQPILLKNFSKAEEETVRRYMNVFGKPRLLRTIRRLNLWSQNQQYFVLNQCHFTPQDYKNICARIHQACPIVKTEKEERS